MFSLFFSVIAPLKLLSTPKIGHCLVQIIKLSFLIKEETWREVTTILVQLINFEDCVQLFALLFNKKNIVTIETTKSHDLHAIWKR